LSLLSEQLIKYGYPARGSAHHSALFIAA